MGRERAIAGSGLPAGMSESETMLRALLDETNDAVLVADDSGRYVAANRAAGLLFGVAPSDIIGKSVSDFTLADFDPNSGWKRARAEGRAAGTFVLMRADGTMRDAEFRAQADVLPGRHLCIIRDVTATRSAEDARLTSERRFRLLVESSVDVCCIFDTERIRYVSPTIRAMLGHEPAEVVGTSPFRLVHPDDIAFVQDELQKLVLTPSLTMHLKARVLHADGTYRIAEVVGRNLFDEPAVRGLVVNFHDVTARERAQEDLARSTAQLRAIFDGALDAMFIADDDARYTDVNAAGLRLLGLQRSDVIGKKTHEVFALEESADANWRRFLDAGELSREMVIGHGESARHVLLRGGANIFPGAHLGILQDLTEQKRAERALADSERRFRLMVESGADVVLVARNGKFTYVSPAVEGVLGYAPQDVIGLATVDLVHPDDHPLVETLRTDFYGPRKLQRAQAKLRMRHAGGGYRVVELTMRDFVDEPTIQGIVVNFHDVTERDRALDELRLSEATLRESRRTLEQAQAIAHIGSWTVDLETLAVEASAETLRIHGSDARSDGDPLEALYARVDAEGRAAGQAAITHAVATGDDFAFDAKLDGEDGPRWIHVHGVVETRPDGRAPRIVGTTLDTTDRRRAEEELRASEARHRRIIETTSEGVWLLDAERRTLFVNRRMAEIVGRTPEEMIGMPGLSFAAEGTAEQMKAAYLQIRDRIASRVETPLRRKDGSTCWVSVAGSPLYDEAGQFEGALAMVTDITASREAVELRARLAAIVESSNDAILSESLDGTILSWNDGAERLYGYPRDEAIGGSATMLVVPGHEEEVAGMLAQIAHGAPQQVDTTHRRKDGSLVEVSVTMSPIRETDGAIVGASAIAHDITERRRAERAERSLHEAEEQLRQAQKLEALGQLAGGVAHDFNNLLSVILGYTSILLDDLGDRDPARADVAEIHDAGVRASDLTRQLLAFSRKQVLQPRVIEVDALLARNEKMLRRLLGEGVELLLVGSPVRKTVRADPGQLEQVLMNLAVNARDAMPAGGRLTLEAGLATLDEQAASRMGVERGDYVTISMTDTGVGVEEAVRGRIFEPFFTTKELGKGTGLGLATVFGIVKQSAGHIELESVVGSGTTFRVFLPATSELPEAVQTSDVADIPTARPGETLLLVEDDERLRTLAHNVLRRAGYRVLDAANAGEALLVCEQHEGVIDMMVTDVVMPRMSGHQLAIRLRAMRPSMRVLYVSGYTDDTVLHHGVESGHLAFLGKPFTPTALIKKVREVLDDPQNT
jgi:two-component system cell cycle sensor histidine kinase/response regulator CckA